MKYKIGTTVTGRDNMIGKIILYIPQDRFSFLINDSYVVQYANDKRLGYYREPNFYKNNYGFESPCDCKWLYENQLTPTCTPKGNPFVLIDKEETK